MDTTVPYSAPALSFGLRLRSRRVRSDRPQAPSVKLLLTTIALAGMVGFTGSILRGDTRLDLSGFVGQVRQSTTALLAMPRTAQVREQQRYADSLRPIHTQLELDVARVGLGAAFYKSRDIDSRELRTRLSQGLASYRQAEAQLAALRPPPALRVPHRDYVDAVRLFEQSALEMLRMYEDGDEEHLAAALPLSLDGTQRLREVSGQVWPDAYPPI
jgi:hypothetical protein